MRQLVRVERDHTANQRSLPAACPDQLGPASDATLTNPEPVRNIGMARQSAQMQRWGDAAYYLRAALSDSSTIIPG